MKRQSMLMFFVCILTVAHFLCLLIRVCSGSPLLLLIIRTALTGLKWQSALYGSGHCTNTAEEILNSLKSLASLILIFIRPMIQTTVFLQWNADMVKNCTVLNSSLAVANAFFIWVLNSLRKLKSVMQKGKCWTRNWKPFILIVWLLW